MEEIPHKEPFQIKRSQFNKEWLDAGREAGFTDLQLKFLEDYHICNHEECPFGQ